MKQAAEMLGFSSAELSFSLWVFSTVSQKKVLRQTKIDFDSNCKKIFDREKRDMR